MAIVIGLVFSLPYLYGVFKFGKDYSPLISGKASYLTEETYTYAPEVWQIVKNHWSGDPYIWEQRNQASPYVSELLSVFPLVVFYEITGSVARAFLISSFIFPPIMFLSIYIFLKKFNFQDPFSIATSLGVVFIPFLSILFPKLQSYGTLLTGDSNGPLFFARIPHPQISTMFVFAAFFLTVIVINENFRNIKNLIAVSLSIALSLYTSVFVSSVVSIASGILLLKFIKRIPVKSLFIASIIIFTLSIPFLINLVFQQNQLSTAEFIHRFTFEKSYMFPIQLRYIFFSLLLLFLRRDTISKVLFCYILVPCFLIDLHQFIFGINFQADHWISRIIAPLSTLTLFLIVQKIIPRAKKIWILMSAVILFIGISRQISWVKSNQSNLSLDKSHRQLIEQLFIRTEQNDVIASFSPDLNNEIIANTGRWIYIAPGDRSWITSEEAIKRICNIGILSQNQFHDSDIINLASSFLALESRDSRKVDLLTKEIQACIKANNFTPGYKLNYIVIKNSHGSWELHKI